MSSPSSLFSLFRHFATTMGTNYEISEVLQELCEHTVVILDAFGAGVCVGTRGANGDERLGFVTATNEQVTVLERAQDELQQGPCVHAWQTGEACAIEGFDETDRWPQWTETARRQGLASVVGIPLSFAGTSVGALNVYDRRPRVWTGEQLEAAQVLADMSAAYLVRAGEIVELRTLSEQLQRALDSRVIIEQAKGMVARDHGIPVDDAFELLRKQSRETNAPLRDIAHAIVHLGVQVPRQP